MGINVQRVDSAYTLQATCDVNKMYVPFEQHLKPTKPSLLFRKSELSMKLNLKFKLRQLLNNLSKPVLSTANPSALIIM